MAYLFIGEKLMKRTAMKLSVIILMGSMIVVCLCSCKARSEDLRIGIIGTSIDHLPLSYWVDKQPDHPDTPKVITFGSGWEVQEALVAGRLDAAIIPFTYAWNAVAKGHPLKIISFFERETDGIIVLKDKASLNDLGGAKIGMIKASTLDILYENWSRKTGFKYDPVYFRTANEMIAALKAGEIKAGVCYEPLISKLDGEISVLHWFGSDYMLHPCCDFVINTKSCGKPKLRTLQDIIAKLDNEIKEVNAQSPELLSYVIKRYGLTREQAISTLDHSKFITGLSREGIEFEKKMSVISLDKGYQSRQVRESEIFLEQSE